MAEAVRLLNAGRVAEAELVCQQVVARQKKNHQALAILGQIASMGSRHQEASQLFTRAVALAPAEIDYHVMLAEALATQGRHREALSRYDKALKHRPDYPPALAGKANVLVRSKAWDDARALLAPYVEAGTEDAAMAIVFARIAVKDKDTERAVEVASRHLDDPVSSEIRRSLWFDLGKAHEAGGRYDEAFEAYTAGNRMGQTPWDPVAASQWHDRIMQVFTAEGMAAHAAQRQRLAAAGVHRGHAAFRLDAHRADHRRAPGGSRGRRAAHPGRPAQDAR